MSALAEPTPEELLAQMSALDVRQLLVSTVMTLASLGYGKLDVGEYEQARLAIEAVSALIPVLGEGVEDTTTRDLRAALANLQVAFADATAASP